MGCNGWLCLPWRCSGLQLMLRDQLPKAEDEVRLVWNGTESSDLSRSTSQQSDEDMSTWLDKDYGRYKYCGLRPDPINPHQCKPDVSLEPLDLPLPALCAKEVAALAEVREAVQDLSATHRIDDSTLLRYLRARKGNAAAATAYFRSSAQWRDSLGVNTALKDWNLRAYEDSLAPWWLSGGVLGLGKQGEPIGWERLGRCHLPSLLSQVGLEDFIKLDIVHTLRSLAAVEEFSMRTGQPLGNAILVQDLDGFSGDQVTVPVARALATLVDNRNKIMPECILRILIIRAPPAFVAAWSMFSAMLDANTREKIQLAGRSKDKSINLLRKYIDDEEIPVFLGGRKAYNGDPESKLILAPGGKVPEFAHARFLALKQEQDDTNIRPGVEEYQLPEGPPETKPGRCCCG